LLAPAFPNRKGENMRVFVIRDNTNACLLTGTRVVQAASEELAWRRVRMVWSGMPPYDERDDSEYQIVEKEVEVARDICILRCEDRTPEPACSRVEMYKEFLVIGTVDGERFSVTVMPYASEYDYHCYPECLDDDDEPLQIAIGQHFADHNIDIGKVGR